MKIIVFSDSHGNYENVVKTVTAHPDADKFIHLGDGEDEAAKLMTDLPDIYDRLTYIGGNRDFGLHTRLAVLPVEDVRILMTHGDSYNVRMGIGGLLSAAVQNGCNAVFFGHTHQKFLDIINGIVVLNPGSCNRPGDGSLPSYAVVKIEDGEISADIKEIK